ncbi:hypothetical protein ACM66B_004370 [Microbotryomycetes sp. NB124-2]
MTRWHDVPTSSDDSDHSPKQRHRRKRRAWPPARNTNWSVFLVIGVVLIVILTLIALALVSESFFGLARKDHEEVASANGQILTSAVESSLEVTTAETKTSQSVSISKTEPTDETLSSPTLTESRPTTSSEPKTQTSNRQNDDKSDSNPDSSLLTDLRIKEFLGRNVGIGSWFETDNSRDFTNGNSWCGQFAIRNLLTD